jgi:hypothetical protein
MRRITRKLLLQRLQEGRAIEARLRGLAGRLEQFSQEDAQELVALVQPELAELPTKGERILEDIDAKT